MTKDKILVFKNRLGEYSETFIYKQANAIKKFDVHYMCSRFVKSGLDEYSNRLTIVCKYKIQYFYELLLSFNISASRYLSEIRKISPRIIHSHFLVDTALLANYKSKINAKLVCTVHGYDITVKDDYAKNSFLNHRRFLNYKESLKNNVDLFIAVSDFIKDKLIEQGFEESKIKRHYIGVDTSKFRPKENMLKGIKRQILFVGRLVEKKGIFDLLEVAKKFKEQNIKFDFIIIGDGPLKESVVNFVDRHCLTNVVLLGKKTQLEIIEHLQTSYVFCVPSKTAENGDSEAFGIVFIESQAVGTPVVSYCHGGISEAVHDGKTGLLCKESDVKGLYENLRAICLDINLRNELSNNCRSFVLDNFDLDKQTKVLEELYSDLLEN